MAIKLYSTDDGHVPAWEYHTIKSGTKVAVGLGLAFDASGKLAASQLPTHICMVSTADPTVATTADMIGPVVRITPDQVWETVNYYELDAEAYPGKKVDLAEGANYVDANETTNGNFEVVYSAGTEMGDVIRGRFVK